MIGPPASEVVGRSLSEPQPVIAASSPIVTTIPNNDLRRLIPLRRRAPLLGSSRSRSAAAGALMGEQHRRAGTLADAAVRRSRPYQSKQRARYSDHPTRRRYTRAHSVGHERVSIGDQTSTETSSCACVSAPSWHRSTHRSTIPHCRSRLIRKIVLHVQSRAPPCGGLPDATLPGTDAQFTLAG